MGMSYNDYYVNLFYHVLSRSAGGTEQPPSVLAWGLEFHLFIFRIFIKLVVVFLNGPPLLRLWLSFLEAIILVVLPVKLTAVLKCLAHGLVPLMVCVGF
jgi:hypothetical protein